MTNFEKWKDRLEELYLKDKGIAIVNGEPVECDCETTECEDCYFFQFEQYCGADVSKHAMRYTKWLLDEVEEA